MAGCFPPSFVGHRSHHRYPSFTPGQYVCPLTQLPPHAVGEYVKAKQYLDQALAIRIQIDDKEGEANSYGNLGNVFLSLGKYDKAK